MPLFPTSCNDLRQGPHCANDLRQGPHCANDLRQGPHCDNDLRQGPHCANYWQNKKVSEHVQLTQKPKPVFKIRPGEEIFKPGEEIFRPGEVKDIRIIRSKVQ